MTSLPGTCECFPHPQTVTGPCRRKARAPRLANLPRARILLTKIKRVKSPFDASILGIPIFFTHSTCTDRRKSRHPWGSADGRPTSQKFRSHASRLALCKIKFHLRRHGRFRFIPFILEEWR